LILLCIIYVLQQALRQIAFRQIFKVLGMPKPLSSGSRSFNKASTSAGGPSPGKKRPRENSTSDAVSPEGNKPKSKFGFKNKKKNSKKLKFKTCLIFLCLVYHRAGEVPTDLKKEKIEGQDA
jgi:hypothetical protein